VTLPVPNLDDRTFQSLVDEAKRLIPMYCPEWTNHNVSDPGVALIELFAWMTEMAIFRLNQVPDRFYTHMLNLIGFQRFPAASARTDLTFWLTAIRDEPVLVPKGSEVSTTGAIGETRVFTTLEPLVISQPTLSGALTAGPDDTFADVWDDLRVDQGSVVCFPSTPIQPGNTFYLRFDDTLAGHALQLDITANVEGIGVLPDRPPLMWQVWEGENWIPVPVYRDTTGGLNRDGMVVMLVPAVHEPLTLGGQRGFWLRALLTVPAPDQPFYRASPQLRSVTARTVGGTVTAEHSSPVNGEFLGISNGRPGQAFQVNSLPVLPRSDEETVTVTTIDGDEQRWAEVADFMDSGPEDRHFTWASHSGEVTFGPRIRYPDGTYRQHGAMPADGARVAVTRYRFGGGAVGNVGAGTITQLRTTVPFVSRVENARAAIGGVDPETVENAKLRGPQSLRAGARAVTAPDFERLTVQADPSIARVRCLPPERTGGPIRLLIVPSLEDSDGRLELDDFALSPRTIQRVTTYIDDRRVLGSTVEIGTPFYQGVTVAALVVARPRRPPAAVHDRALDALYRYLNPLTGGPDGNGWPFDTDLNSAAIYQLLEGVDGVERVDEVVFFEYDLRNGERMGFAQDVVTLERHSLFLSAKHQVVVR
jgi:predicted phage baseplate assembly protein